jgi:hypothetical protein
MLVFYYSILFFVLYSIGSNVTRAIRRNCTAKCTIQMSFDDQFQRSSNCSQRTISDTCVARVTILYNTRQIFVHFRTTGSEYNENDFTLYATQQVSYIFKSNYISYTIVFVCYFDDDCDWTYSHDIINRFTKTNYALVFNKLKSLLYDSSTTAVSQCYSQNNMINCNHGVCSSIISEGNSHINRSCIYPSDFYLGIDIRRYRIFPLKFEENQNYIFYLCNQNLCNNPTSENSIQSIIRSYTFLFDIPEPSKTVAVIRNDANYLIVIVILLHFV